MATEPRVLGGIGLNGFWPQGADGWKDGVDANWLKLSALTQLVLDAHPTIVLPTSPADGYIAIDPSDKKVAVRDNGAWVKYTPKLGWSAAYQEKRFRYDGAGWQEAANPNYDDYNSMVSLINSIRTSAFGIGQSNQNVGAGRGPNTNFTNNTGRPILAAVASLTTGANGRIILYIDDALAGNDFNPTSGATVLCQIVIPAGSTYRAVPVNGNISSWWEFRNNP
ncbi:hypothetical protein AXY1_49 [Achromobacter phage AXY1]|nr:hypothetical protein AXY1_49 [Achromobacter phage AXY1]